MFGRSTGILVAACALGASALLIPPGVAPASHNEAALPIIANPLNQFITIPCSECVFSSKQEKVDEGAGDLLWTQGRSNNIIFNFTISDDGRTLQLDGKDIAAGLKRAHKVHQIPESASVGAFEAGQVDAVALEITSAMVVSTPSHTSPKNIKDLHTVSYVDITILGLEHQRMQLDKVKVTTLETADGQTLILNVESFPSDLEMIPMAPLKFLDELALPQNGRSHGLGHQSKNMHKECGGLPVALCKLKHVVEGKIHGISKTRKGRPCPGRKGQHSNPWMGKDGHVRLPSHIKGPKFDNEENSPHHDRPHHGRPHHGRPGSGHHRYHHNSFLRAFTKGFVAVLVPVMAGVTVGMLVSLVGVAIGRLISFLWIKVVRRGGRRGYASVSLEESTTEEGNFKDGEIAEMEAPPMYEHAPRYEDVENSEKN